jgi:hypothetical protein
MLLPCARTDTLTMPRIVVPRMDTMDRTGSAAAFLLGRALGFTAREAFMVT